MKVLYGLGRTVVNGKVPSFLYLFEKNRPKILVLFQSNICFIHPSLLFTKKKGSGHLKHFKSSNAFECLQDDKLQLVIDANIKLSSVLNQNKAMLNSQMIP